MKLLVYTAKITSRSAYIFQLMIEDLAGFAFQITTERHDFEHYKGPKLAYGSGNVPDVINIPNAGFLDTLHVNDAPQHFVTHNDIDCPFAVEGKDFPFDLFSASFYLVVRCEEYRTTDKDGHGRFKSSASLAYQHSFLDEPVVNSWALELRRKLLERYPELAYEKRAFRCMTTLDIDQAYAIRARGLKRTLGRLGKQFLSFEWRAIINSLEVLLGSKKDPFDTFDYISSLKQKYHHELLCFIHLGDYDTFDKSIRWNHRLMKRLMQRLSAFTLTGIHPSYRSNESIAILKEEHLRYKTLFHQQAKRSRQHYLKMSLPLTYRILLSLGVEEDYTMGYAECTGFRASICTPFYFYDLENECATSLKIIPLAAMDRTLKDSMKLTVDESISELTKIRGRVKSLEGTFVSLFHNETLAENKEWNGWRKVYESVLQH